MLQHERLEGKVLHKVRYINTLTFIIIIIICRTAAYTVYTCYWTEPEFNAHRFIYMPRAAYAATEASLLPCPSQFLTSWLPSRAK